MEELLTVSEAGKQLKIGRTYLYRLMNEGKIKAKKLGKKTLIPIASVNEYVASLPVYKEN